MKIVKWALMVWALCAGFLFLLAIFSVKSNKTETRLFCAYGRIFVEFEENGKTWGTLMLDYDGRPILCKEDDVNIENTI